MSGIALSLVLNVTGFAILFLIFGRRIKRSLDTDRVVDGVREEISGLIVELNQITDRNVGLIEERIERLRALVAAADKKIQLAGREMQKHQIGMEVYNKLKKGASRLSGDTTPDEPQPVESQSVESQPAEPQPAETAPSSRPHGLPQSNSDATESSLPLEAVAESEELHGEVGTGDATVPGLRPKHLTAEVVALAANGFDSRIIANRLGTTIGEVELILSLHTGTSR